MAYSLVLGILALAITGGAGAHCTGRRRSRGCVGRGPGMSTECWGPPCPCCLGAHGCCLPLRKACCKPRPNPCRCRGPRGRGAGGRRRVGGAGALHAARAAAERRAWGRLGSQGAPPGPWRVQVCGAATLVAPREASTGGAALEAVCCGALEVCCSALRPGSIAPPVKRFLVALCFEAMSTLGWNCCPVASAPFAVSAATPSDSLPSAMHLSCLHSHVFMSN